VNRLLKEGWQGLSEDAKEVFRGWTEWDKKRYDRDLAIFESRRHGDGDTAAAEQEDSMKAIHVPKKRKKPTGDVSAAPKKQRKA